MLVLGIDPGLAHTGWALVDASGALHRFAHVATGRLPGVGDVQRRLGLVLRDLTAPMRDASVVVVEWPGMGGARQAGKMNAVAASQTAAAAAAAIGLAVGMGGGRRILTPAPVTWRARLGAKRGADAALHEALMGRYPILADLRLGARPHVLDAVGLALYGRLVLRLDHEDMHTHDTEEIATP